MPERKDKPERQRSHRNMLTVETGDESVSGGSSVQLSLSVVSDSWRPHGPYCPWTSLGQNTIVGSRSLLQGIFPSQGSSPGLPHGRQILYQPSYKGSPTTILKEVQVLLKVC